MKPTNRNRNSVPAWAYQRRPRKAIAEQFDGVHVPTCLTSALLLKGYLMVRDADTGAVIGTLNKGDWIVTGEDGRIRLMYEDEFLSKYEPLITE